MCVAQKNEGLISTLMESLRNETLNKKKLVIVQKPRLNKKKLVIVRKEVIVSKEPGIVLFEYQIGHVQKLQEILRSSYFALDLSMLGTGKTYTAAKVALEGGYRHIIVIAPPSVKTKWLELQREYSLPITAAISYQELRSVRGSQPKHGLLSRREMAGAEFTPTDLLKTYIAEGAIFIIDEIQNIKNCTAQFQACHALVRCVAAGFPVCNSRVLFISGSPVDKKCQVINFYRCIRAFTHQDLCIYNQVNGTYEMTGFQQIVDFCTNIEAGAREEAQAALEECTKEGAEMPSACVHVAYRLFLRYVKLLSSEMPPPQYRVAINKLNGFFRIDQESRPSLVKAVGALAKACYFGMPDEGAPGAPRDDNAFIAIINKAMHEIERSKINLFARLAKKSLAENPDAKVVLCINYSETLTALQSELEEYSPMVMHGATSVSMRGEIIRRFQARGQKDRLLICNASVCSTGIDLDDKYGEHPRVCYVSPLYNTITLYQLSHRFLRADTRSNSTMYMVYVAGDDCLEKRIMRSLAKKSGVMREITSGQAAAGVLFPGSFPDYVEE